MNKRISLALLFLIAVPVIAQEPAAATNISVVMSGLDNPRSLAFGPEGALYVAEAGRGGSGPCFVAFGQNWCYGPSGKVERLWKGKQQVVIDGLPSWAHVATMKQAAGFRAQGTDGISFQGRGNMYVSIGWERRADQRQLLAGEGGLMFDRLIRVTPDGQFETVTDLAEYEIANPTPDLESDPFKVRAEPGRELVVDAGANRVLEVRANGEVSTIADFPPHADGRQSVPTSIVLGPDGAYYVSELTGIVPGQNFANGVANIYRLVEGSAPEVFLTGFTQVIDLAFDSMGNLYVLEHQYISADKKTALPGKLKRVELNGCPTAANLCPRTTVLDNLATPTAILIGPDDEIYMSVNGTQKDIGAVWKVKP